MSVRSLFCMRRRKHYSELLRLRIHVRQQFINYHFSTIVSGESLCRQHMEKGGVSRTACGLVRGCWSRTRKNLIHPSISYFCYIFFSWPWAAICLIFLFRYFTPVGTWKNKNEVRLGKDYCRMFRFCVRCGQLIIQLKLTRACLRQVFFSLLLFICVFNVARHIQTYTSI